MSKQNKQNKDGEEKEGKKDKSKDELTPREAKAIQRKKVYLNTTQGGLFA